MDKTISEMHICPRCGGSGQKNEIVCHDCNGAGVIARIDGVRVSEPIPFNYREPSYFPILFGFKRILVWTVGLLSLSFFPLLFRMVYDLIFHEHSDSIHIDIFHQGIWSVLLFLALGAMILDLHLSLSMLHPQKKLTRFSPKEAYRVSDFLSNPSEKVLRVSYKKADEFGSPEISALHIMYAVFASYEMKNVKKRVGLHKGIQKVFLENAVKGGVSSPNFLREYREVLVRAFLSAKRSDHYWIEVSDIFVGAYETSEQVRLICQKMGIHLEDILTVFRWETVERHIRNKWLHIDTEHLSAHGKIDAGWSTGWTVELDKMSEDITKKVKRSKKKMVNRAQEVSALSRLLRHSEKNNVLIVGETGTGRRSLIYSLSQAISKGNVPKDLRNKRLIGLQSSVFASSDEKTMQRILNEIERSTNVILVIENIHALHKTSSNHGVDIYAILNQFYQSSKTQCIATTTPQDYSKYLEQDEVFSKHFFVLELDEPDDDLLMEIMHSSMLRFEKKYKITVGFRAVKAAIHYSKRYIHDTRLPQKAITLLDDACVVGKTERGKHTVIIEEDIKRIVSERTHIPVGDISEESKQKILGIEDELKQRIIGQDTAVREVSNAIHRERAGLHDHSRPVASFLFVGPTGVGKTEVAKSLADIYFGSEESMIRFDMSEYGTSESVHRLLGTRTSHGDINDGLLTGILRKHPYSLVLLDEFEKAHSDIHNIFLQLLDDGRITDSFGRKVDATNAIFIATSNAGAQFLLREMEAGVKEEKIIQDLLNIELPKVFKPELINRFDRVIPFHALSADDVFKIAELMIAGLKKRLKKRDITLNIDSEVIREIGRLGYSPLYGARPLRKVVSTKLEDIIAQKILHGEIKKGEVATLTLEDLEK